MTLEDVQKRIHALGASELQRPDRLFPHVLSAFAEYRVEQAELEEDGDMLLFQWGTYDWGHGRHFEVDLTRQVILPSPDPEDDPSYLQLRCSFLYPPEGFEPLG